MAAEQKRSEHKYWVKTFFIAIVEKFCLFLKHVTKPTESKFSPSKIICLFVTDTTAKSRQAPSKEAMPIANADR